ncbi:MAG: hypothetical protein B6247_29195 [Candidatus Parabeggiatoa sp. nov. 2]|nr:MAG: hypothetical protein B6247_29195 [Beggiatoa sp. 4572_84]
MAQSLCLCLAFIRPIHSANAVDPVTAGVVVGGAAKAAVEGTAAAVAAGAVGTAAAAAVASPVVGLAAGVGTAAVMNDQLFDEAECKKAKTEKACKAARISTYTGAAVGTAGSLAALGVAGASTAGLATIGGAIGGGAIVGAAA